MQGKNKYFRRSRLSEAESRRIVPYFTHDLPASKITELSDVGHPTINQLLFKPWTMDRSASWRVIALLRRGQNRWILFRRAPCSWEERA